MADRFRPINRDTPHLFPPTVQDYLPDDHLARFVVDIVEQLDLTPLTRAYGGRGGSAAWHPAMLVSLLFYGYATGTFSSRKLEAATYDSVAVRFICANQHPDQDSISAFRKRFLSELDDLFVQILVIAHEMGTLQLGTVSLDGTKIKANASKHKALGWRYANALEAQLRAEVEELMRVAQVANNTRLPYTLDIPAENDNRATIHERDGFIYDAESPEAYVQSQADFLRSRIEAIGANYQPWPFRDRQEYYFGIVVEKIELKSLFDRGGRDFCVPLTNSRGWADIYCLVQRLTRVCAEPGLCLAQKQSTCLIGSLARHASEADRLLKAGQRRSFGGTYGGTNKNTRILFIIIQ